MRDGKVYGRGAVDDKASVDASRGDRSAHAHQRTIADQRQGVFEGEEEIGSPNFEAAVERYRKKFEADVAVISDTGMYSKEIPS